MSRAPTTNLDLPSLTSARVRTIRTRLLAWYEAHQQPFAWRTARDPYSALVAAVAAQQTQMSRVIEVHERWMRAFPTLGDLARADRAEVLRVWGRAGYPRRAVALHETAARCMPPVEEGGHGGALPRDPVALLALPGVGPFTAAIVRTFGWGDDAPAVDTNVVRVIGRLVCGDLQPARETSPALIEAIATRLLPRGDAARWNPALMDYGGRVCLPRPRCDECVLASICAARPRFAAGEVAEPVRAQGRFDGSDRQLRGRIMHALREAANVGLRESTLLASLDDVARAQRLLATLVADGLAWRARGRVGLGMVPSSRPAGPDGAGRVSRPSPRKKGYSAAMSERIVDTPSHLVEVVANIGSYGNNAYILSGADRTRVTIIDAPEGAEAILEAVGTRTIERIVVTHSHFDHWAGFDVLRAATSAPVHAGAEETNLEASRGILPLAHDETIDVGGTSALVLHTPGHTPGSICVRFGGVVLTGDTLFPGGPGRTRDHAALLQEIASITSTLLTLPSETLVLPGHGPTTTIARAAEEYAVFAAKPDNPELHGDVLWGA